MVDTNALLSIAFAMIANFTNVVQIPPQAVPTKPEDLERCIIGRPGSPVHLILTHRKGTEFWIGDGAVYSYRSPGSYFDLQGPPRIERFTGTTTMTSDDAVQLATKVLRRLAKNEDRLNIATPRIRYPSSDRIPFFEVNFLAPLSYGGGVLPAGDTVATVEIDGRNGSIVELHLFDSATFFDPSLEQNIRAQVYTPEPRATNAAPVKTIPRLRPTTNYVSEVIKNWLALCDKVGLDPGAQTNLAEVDWGQTMLFAHPMFSNQGQACRVSFKNRVFFDSLNGVVFDLSSPDAYFVGNYMSKPPEERLRFVGTVTKRWQDLAKELEGRLCERLGVPKSMFEQSKPAQAVSGGTFGESGIVRMLVWWHRLPERDEDNIARDSRSYLGAEFDLQTGQTKAIVFQDPDLIQLVGRALRGSK